MTELVQEKCVACRRDSPLATDEEVAELYPKVAEWAMTSENSIPQLQRTFSFPNFAQALAFSSSVGEAAEDEGHHPRIVTEWGKVTVTLVDSQDTRASPQRLHHGGQDGPALRLAFQEPPDI